MKKINEIKTAAQQVAKTKKTIELEEIFVGWSKALQKVVIIPKDEIQ